MTNTPAYFINEVSDFFCYVKFRFQEVIWLKDPSIAVEERILNDASKSLQTHLDLCLVKFMMDIPYWMTAIEYGMIN